MARTSDPIDALLSHNHWATRLILEKCRALSDEQFRRPFPIGPGDHGGLHAILSHIIGAMRRWADRIADRPVRAPLEAWRRSGGPDAAAIPPHDTVDDLLVLLDDAHRDLVAVIAAARTTDLAREIVLRFSTPNGPGSTSFTTGAAIASAAVHGHYHRAQCMNILRQFNIPGATVDVIDWQQAME